MKKTFALLIIFSFIAQAKNTSLNFSPTIENFIKNTAKKNHLDEKSIRIILSQAEKKQSIIDAMNRPAEKKKKWHEYREIFLQQKRIDKGALFWKKHKKTLEKVQKSTGVPVELITAIIGVETNYGGNKGSYRVIDALYTLAFHYPKRSPFFTSELEKFLVLITKEKVSALKTKGSYAGAMGYGQFMPSSYLMYAVDFDKDGQRDLLNNVDDAIASVANYFKAHGWKKNQAITYQGYAKKDHKKLEKQDLKPSLTVKQLNNLGYFTKHKLNKKEKISLTQLQQKKSTHYWFGLHNFYVITRYNHSEMYAMAVFQLAQEIKSKYVKS